MTLRTLLAGNPDQETPTSGPVGVSRRVRVLVGAALVATAGLIVVGDLSAPATRGQRAADLSAFYQSVAADIQPCQLAVQETFHAYHFAGPSPSRKAIARSVAVQDLATCSPAGASPMYSLSTMPVPHNLTHLGLQSALNDVNTWAWPNAAAAIQDAGTLVSYPHRASALADLKTRNAAMVSYGKAAEAVFANAAKKLHTHLPSLGLTSPGT